MTNKILVTYATKFGATASIAAAVAAELQAIGHEVDVREVSSVLAVSPYDAVVVGSALYNDRWRPEAVDFLRNHQHQLRGRPVWLFHSGPVGAAADEDQELPPDVLHLAVQIHAHPVKTFAGALRPESLGSSRARRRAQLDDVDFTDSRAWSAIRRWARQVGATLSPIHLPV